LDYHILLAETRDIVRAGLKKILLEDPHIISIDEVKTLEELCLYLATTQPDVIVIHEALVSDFTSLPEGRFILLATTPDEEMLLAAHACGARAYLLESCSEELLLVTLHLADGVFLLDPQLTSWALASLRHNRLPGLARKLLTAREQEIFSLVRNGLSNHAIGEVLSISDATVKTHVSNIFHKLGIKKRSMVMSLPESIEDTLNKTNTRSQSPSSLKRGKQVICNSPGENAIGVFLLL